MGKKWVYLFTEGNADMRTFGGKGSESGRDDSLLVFRFHRGLLLPRKLVPSITRMVERSMMRSWDRLTNISRRWNRLQARSLEIWRIHF